MSYKLTQIASAVSGDTQNATDVNEGRAPVELHRQSDAKYAAYDYETMRVKSNRSEIETSEHSYIPSEIEELRETYEKKDQEEEKEMEQEEEEEQEDEEEQDEEEQQEVEEDEEEEDIRNVYKNEEEQGYNELYIAVERGDSMAVERLLMSSVDVNLMDANKNTRLQLRATVKRLLYKNASVYPRNATVDVMRQARKREFYLAAKNGHADVVDVLLFRGICDFVVSYWYETPLHIAVIERHTKVVEVIMKHRCRTSGKLTKDEQKLQENAKNLVETRGIIPIEFMKPDGRCVSAGIVWREKSTPLETILELDGYTALELAVKSIQLKMVKMLLSVDPCVYSEKHIGNSFRCMIKTMMPPDGWYEHISEEKQTDIKEIMKFLCYDIQYKMKFQKIKEIAHVLMNSSKFNVNYQDDKLNTLLHEVIKQCGECVYDYLAKKSRPRRLRMKTIDDVIQMLLKKGADFNIKNAFGETPLIIASDKGCSHVIQIFLDWEHKSGMKLDLDARDQSGATALIKAAETHHVSVMRLLLNHKVSVNLHDYYEFTALHAAVYEPNRNWFDLHFFCKGICIRKLNMDEFSEITSRSPRNWGNKTVKPYEAVGRLEENLEHDEKTTRFKEEMVKLLLAIDELNVNAIDVRGNTPLDLAEKSSERITSETFEALEDRGAIQNLPESIDEAPMEVARVDERGRSPLHRLIIAHISNYEGEDMKAAKREIDHERFDLMVHGILLKPENFRRSVTATDDKGRTALHYAVMPPSYARKEDRDLVRVLLEMGSKVNAADMYGKTPLHYAEMNDQYDLLVQNEADESTKDKYRHTPRDLRQLRELVTISTDNAKNLAIGKTAIYLSKDFACELNTDHVTELSKRKLAEAVRVYSQSPCLKESSSEAIWKVWIENEFLSLNRRVIQLKPCIQRLIERLADGIKEKDWRFECQPILVGSADEETKAVISADFDFNFKLIHFSQLCDMFPHPLGPKGYFQLRRKRDNTERRQRDEKFDCFFNLDQYLLTNDVNSRFQILLEDVLHSSNFWQNEHLFEWNLTDFDEQKQVKPAGMCKTVRLRMIHPIEDGEGGFLFVNVSIDVVACVQVEDLWLGDQLSVAISAAVKTDGCTLVFDRPRFDPSKPRGVHFMFSDTFARISFALLESRMIRESSSLIKAAYIVCKLILYGLPKTTYLLKTSVLFCMEALKGREGCQTKDGDDLAPKELAFWVERIMFCFMEFHRHDVYPCFFMPSFRQRVVQINNDHEFVDQYSAAYNIYLDLCPDDTTFDIPIVHRIYRCDITEGNPIANQDPKWEQFDWEEFITKLSSRSSSY